MKKNILAVVLVMLLTILISTPIAYSADVVYDITQKFTKKVTAGEAIAAGQLVYIKTSDGLFYIADANGSSTYPAVCVSANAAAVGDTVDCVIAGRVYTSVTLTVGQPVYLSTTAGTVTSTEPTTGTRQTVGLAINANEYQLDIKTTTSMYNYYTTTICADISATQAYYFIMPFAATLTEVSGTGDFDYSQADETYALDVADGGGALITQKDLGHTDDTPVVATITDSAVADNAVVLVTLTLGGTSPSFDGCIVLTFKTALTQ
jgi:hypothetical protein